MDRQVDRKKKKGECVAEDRYHLSRDVCTEFGWIGGREELRVCTYVSEGGRL